MRAIQVTRLDGPGAFELVSLPDLLPREDEVLIDVHAAGVTFPEVLQSRGLYQMKPALPFIPGSEVAGMVVAAPEGSGFRAGDRVAAFPLLGGFAEQVSVDPLRVFPLPEEMSFTLGAGVPMNYLTMHFALKKRGWLQRGETVLVQGAAGGIGTATTQLAKAYGARVIAVVSSEPKRSVAKEAGADEVVLAEGFLAAVKTLTDGRGVDMVVDPVGGDRFTDSLRSLASGGRLLVVGFTAGQIPEVKVNRLLLNNISVVGVAWGSYFMQHPHFMQEQWADLKPLLATLKPPILATYPLEKAGEAVTALERRQALGKVVLAVKP